MVIIGVMLLNRVVLVLLLIEVELLVFVVNLLVDVFEEVLAEFVWINLCQRGSAGTAVLTFKPSMWTNASTWRGSIFKFEGALEERSFPDGSLMFILGALGALVRLVLPNSLVAF